MSLRIGCREWVIAAAFGCFILGFQGPCLGDDADKQQLPHVPRKIKGLAKQQLLAMEQHAIYEMNGKTGEVAAPWPLPERVAGLELCAVTENLIAFWDDTPKQFSVTTYDFRTKKVVSTVDLERGWYVQGICANQAGSKIAWVEGFSIGYAPEIGKKSDFARMRVADAATGKVLSDVKLPLYFPQGQTFDCIAWTADEGTIVVGGQEGQGAIYVLDVKTAKITWQTKEKYGAFSIAICPDGKSFFSTDLAGEVDRWDMATGKILSTWTVYTGAPMRFNPLGGGAPDRMLAVCVSADQKYVAAAADLTHQLIVWDIATGTAVQSVDTGTPVESALDFSADGSTVWYAGTLDKKLHRLEIGK